MDPTNKEIDLDNLMYSKLKELSDEDLKKQEGDYIYRYRYNGGGATQVWLSSDRYWVRSTCYHMSKQERIICGAVLVVPDVSLNLSLGRIKMQI